MTAIDYFAWFIFLTIVISVVFVLVSLAQLPGKFARDRNHPQADAINLASWLGMLLTMGVVWVVAMIWSRMVPYAPAGASGHAETDLLQTRISDIEARLADIGKKEQSQA